MTGKGCSPFSKVRSEFRRVKGALLDFWSGGLVWRREQGGLEGNLQHQCLSEPRPHIPHES